jgi:hypothetical protein
MVRMGKAREGPGVRRYSRGVVAVQGRVLVVQMQCRGRTRGPLPLLQELWKWMEQLVHKARLVMEQEVQNVPDRRRAVLLMVLQFVLLAVHLGLHVDA